MRNFNQNLKKRGENKVKFPFVTLIEIDFIKRLLKLEMKNNKLGKEV